MVGKINKNQVERTTNAGTKEQFPSRPCVAIVRNHLDSTYMGNLEVEILTSSNAGQSTNAPGQLLPVKYLSPFAGVTSLEGTSKNAGAVNSQRSYGFWGVPPDINSKVLVIFAEGGDGYWIGCIPEDHTNIMTPDPWVSSTFNDKDKTKKLPVVEYNKKTESGNGRDSTKFIKPANQDAIDALTTQGLLEDEIRGTTSTSARREVPSAVTGFSSPGPQDKRPGAPRVNYGENFAQTPTPQNRLGGSSLVFDDGDASLVRKTPAKDGPPVYINVEGGEKGGDPTLPHNELIRLRTRTGHQILLHNTEDLIYIANARGTTWIELTANGKIDIYAQDSVNVHSESDINLKADKNVNIEAGENINLKAGADTNVTAPGSVNLDTPDTNMKNLDVTGSAIISADINTGTLSAGSVNGTAAGTAWADTDGLGSTDNQKLGSHSAASPTTPTSAIPSQRVPEHEPWAGHENLGGSVASTPDTFKKNTQRDVRETPSTQPAEVEEAPAASADTGVVSTKASPAGAIPDAVASSLDSVAEGVSSLSVGNLVNSVVDAGKAITFGVGQAIVGAIDNIAGPGLLSKVSSFTGLGSSAQAAGDLLGLRTTLAKGSVPAATVSVPDSIGIASIIPGQDDKIIGDVFDGKYREGDVVTLSDGQYRVQNFDEDEDYEAGYGLTPL